MACAVVFTIYVLLVVYCRGYVGCSVRDVSSVQKKLPPAGHGLASEWRSKREQKTGQGSDVFAGPLYRNIWRNQAGFPPMTGGPGSAEVGDTHRLLAGITCFVHFPSPVIFLVAIVLLWLMLSVKKQRSLVSSQKISRQSKKTVFLSTLPCCFFTVPAYKDVTIILKKE